MNERCSRFIVSSFVLAFWMVRPGVPLELRHEQLERFAGEVGVRYSDRFKVPSPTAG